MSTRLLRHFFLAVMVGLTACGSTPTWQPSEPYWEQADYKDELLRAVQSVVHTLSDTTPMPADRVQGTVRFTLTDGRVEYPELIVSTGDHDLDKLMLQQLSAAQPPTPTGPHADEPHEFEMQLQMPTPFESFQYSIYDAINNWRKYPKDAIISGDMGFVVIGFDYLDGKVSNVIVIKPARSRFLNSTSVESVVNATLPAPLPPYTGKTFHMETVFCYSLNEDIKCPEAENVISVTGTIVRRF